MLLIKNQNFFRNEPLFFVNIIPDRDPLKGKSLSNLAAPVEFLDEVSQTQQEFYKLLLQPSFCVLFSLYINHLCKTDILVLFWIEIERLKTKYGAKAAPSSELEILWRRYFATSAPRRIILEFENIPKQKRPKIGAAFSASTWKPKIFYAAQEEAFIVMKELFLPGFTRTPLFTLFKTAPNSLTGLHWKYLSIKMQSEIDGVNGMKDLTFHGKTFKGTFLGKQGVEWLEDRFFLADSGEYAKTLAKGLYELKIAPVPYAEFTTHITQVPTEKFDPEKQYCFSIIAEKHQPTHKHKHKRGPSATQQFFDNLSSTEKRFSVDVLGVEQDSGQVTVNITKLKKQAQLSQASQFHKTVKEKTEAVEQTFNNHPVKGVELLISSRLVEKAAPDLVADFLFRKTLDKEALGSYLGEDESFAKQVMSHFIKLFNFRHMDFDSAFRYLLSTFKIPGESQKIYRIVEEFSKVFYDHNPEDYFQQPDAVHSLAYATLMLNVDAHSKQVKKKMTAEEFIKNCRGTNKGSDFPEDFLRGLYDTVVFDEIKLSGIQASTQVYRRGHAECRISFTGKTKKPWKTYWVVISATSMSFFKKMTDKNSTLEIALTPRTQIQSALPKEKDRLYIFGLSGPESEISNSGTLMRAPSDKTISHPTSEGTFECELHFPSKTNHKAITWAKTLKFVCSEKKSSDRQYSILKESQE